MPGSIRKSGRHILIDILPTLARYSSSGWPVFTSQNVVVGTGPGLRGVGEEQTKALQPLNGPLPGDTNERPEKRPRVCNPLLRRTSSGWCLTVFLQSFLIAKHPVKLCE